MQYFVDQNCNVKRPKIRRHFTEIQFVASDLLQGWNIVQINWYYIKHHDVLDWLIINIRQFLRIIKQYTKLYTNKIFYFLAEIKTWKLHVKIHNSVFYSQYRIIHANYAQRLGKCVYICVWFLAQW